MNLIMKNRALITFLFMLNAIITFALAYNIINSRNIFDYRIYSYPNGSDITLEYNIIDAFVELYEVLEILCLIYALLSMLVLIYFFRHK